MKAKFSCGFCGVEFYDYESNRTKTVSGLFFCSPKHRAAYRSKKSKENSPIKDFSRCVSCGETKSVSEFYKDKKCVANGCVQYSCKMCIKKEREKYYDQHTEEVNKRVRTHRKENPGKRKSHPDENSLAHKLLNEAVKKGKIVKPKLCENCHKKKWLHAHHYKGYDYPLEVVWLCPSCHHAAHGRGPQARA